MMILEEIAETAKRRVRESESKLPLRELKAMAADCSCETDFPFERAIAGEELSFICEVKKGSPSKGIIAEDFPYERIAMEYEEAGAAAISVLTEPFYFHGSGEYLRQIRRKVRLPLLRKDFTVDEYMIYEAKVLGADAVLLICAILEPSQLREYVQLSCSLGLSALVEAHDENEIFMALDAGAGIIGVNNRNLKDFSVDIGNSLRLRGLVPQDVIFVSESGMRTPEDIGRFRENGVDAVLIGETLMRSADKKAALERLASGSQGIRRRNVREKALV